MTRRAPSSVSDFLVPTWARAGWAATASESAIRSFIDVNEQEVVVMVESLFDLNAGDRLIEPQVT
jgi:hypothetical protein